MEKINAWTKYSPAQTEELEALCAEYRDFLSRGKTERECVALTVEMAEACGYRNLSELIENGETVKAGDKIYAVNMGKAIILFKVGARPIEQGMNILGAHIDSPRLDVKQNPLYEDSGFAYLDTHYYGGVKKYQWVALPLAIHGVVAKKNGEVVNVVIGEDEDDPVVSVTDLLPHLAANQMQKKASVVIEGEKLDVLIGSRPLKTDADDTEAEKVEDGEKGAKYTESEDGEGEEVKGKKAEKEAVKANILKLLKEKYDIEEADFLSAELEIVPAGKARETGIDRSMIMSYGQDDRVCAFTSLKALLDVGEVEKTACCILVDKEEIGSVGATGMESKFFENTVAELLDCMDTYSDLVLRRTLANSKMLSSDVNAAYDPLYADAYEKRNSSMAGCGMVFNKFTGARGKSGSNDANAEYIAEIRHIMDEAGVRFQLAELGKVDVGGGGTIAYILALYGMNVIDCGVAVLNMHAPWEITSKADIYETKRGYEVFLRDMK